MTDIAQKANVARSTVSHVLNDRNSETVRIPVSTRQRILDTARERGYRPNELARSVALGRSRMIGYLVEETSLRTLLSTIVDALAAAEELGFTLKVLSVNEDSLIERIHQCIDLRLSGVIVRVNSNKSVLFEEANRAQIPVVTVDEGIVQPSGACVTADDTTGFLEAIEHLYSLGHRKIGFISSIPTN